MASRSKFQQRLSSWPKQHPDLALKVPKTICVIAADGSGSIFEGMLPRQVSDDLATMRAVELRARKELLLMGLGRVLVCRQGRRVLKSLRDNCTPGIEVCLTTGSRPSIHQKR